MPFESEDKNNLGRLTDAELEARADEIAGEILRKTSPFIKSGALLFYGLQVGAGAALAVASSAALPVALGVGAAVYSAVNAFQIITTKFDVETVKKPAPRKNMLTKAFNLAGNVATAGAGIALFGIAGADASFITAAAAGLAATFMSIKGGLGTLANAGSILFHKSAKTNAAPPSSGNGNGNGHSAPRPEPKDGKPSGLDAAGKIDLTGNFSSLSDGTGQQSPEQDGSPAQNRTRKGPKPPTLH